MIKGKHHCLLQLDPRTKILLLLVANILLFFGSSSEVTYIYMAVLAMVLLLSECYKSLLAFGVIGTLFISINYWIFPIAPKVFTMIFSISVNYTLKMFPCLMSGALLISTTSLHDVVLAMRKCHFPQKLIITLSVTVFHLKLPYFDLHRTISDNTQPITNVARITIVNCPVT